MAGGRRRSVVAVADGEGRLWICASIGREMIAEAWLKEERSRGQQMASDVFSDTSISEEPPTINWRIRGPMVVEGEAGVIRSDEVVESIEGEGEA